ncbi:MAG: glycosyltransferase [Chloroflexi bacterium]|nr:glycosyltransferase [Chloroflexota bacterium]
MEALDALNGPFEIDIVVGPFHPFEKELRDYRGPHEVRVHKGLTTLAPLMETCDLMISGAGSTIWEACCVGIPLILVQTEKNQAEVANTVRAGEAGICMNASELIELGNEVFASAVAEAVASASDGKVRKRLSERAKRLVDGRGAERVVAAMFEYKI